MSEKINPTSESTGPFSAPEVINEAVTLSRRPIIELHSQISRGDYKVVFGDDASGRILALIWREFLGKVNASKEQPKPETLFLAGSKDLTSSQMLDKVKKITAYLERRHLKDLFQDKNDRALIVTDTIQTGQSLLPLTYALANIGVRYDIVTNVLIDEVPQIIVESNLGARIHYGDKRHSDTAPYSYKNVSISGVAKNAEDLFARPQDLNNPETGQTTHEILSQSRELVEPAAQKMFEYYSQLK